MAAPLDIAARKQGVEYHHQVTEVLAGLDLDANENTIDSARFWDLRNWRIETPGEISIRSGIREHVSTLATGGVPPVAATNFAVVATSEYILGGSTSRIEDARRYAVVVFWDGDGISFVLGNKTNEGGKGQPGSPSTPLSIDAFGNPQDEVLYGVPIHLPLTGVSVEPPVGICQIGNSLIITVFDHATYECYPTPPLPSPGTPIPDGGLWTIHTLGKEVCPVPGAWSFAKDTNGDLLIYDAPNTNNYQFTPLSDALTGEWRVIRVPIGAKYWISDDASGAFYAVLAERPWVFPDGSGNTLTSTYDATTQHSKTRAWGYRFVAVQSQIDSKGNTVIRHSKASADIWIEDRIYKPATFGFVDTGKEVFVDTVFSQSGRDDRWWSKGDDGTDWHFSKGRFLGVPLSSDCNTHTAPYNAAYGGPTFFPTPDDFFNLQSKFRGYAADMTVDPYFFAATWLGWVKQKGSPVSFNGAAPYKVAVPASELRGAPLTIFRWSDFSGLPDGTTEIRIFRTGHFGHNDKADSDVDSLSEPHTYGYVGSVKPPSSGSTDGSVFTDDVKDNAIDTGETPEDYDGLEVGQFSGQVARDFMTKLVLGNIKTTYWVDTPGPEVSAVFFPGSYYVPSTDFIAAPDGLNVIAFHYAYVDQEGNQSALHDVALNNVPHSDTWVGGDGPTDVELVLPRGMDPFVTNVRVFQSHYETLTGGTGRYYFDRGTFPVSQATILVAQLDTSETPLSPVPDVRPQRDVRDYYQPSQGIYSVGNQPYNFPPQNVEQWHPYGAVVGLDVVYGDLIVFTTDGLTWTTLTGGTVRVEENTKETGAIGRFAIQKWNQAVFFLASNGLYIAEGDAAHPIAGRVQSAIREYLDEYIPGQPRHANARRASIGVLGHRYEVVLHFPSSIDLWTAAKAVDDTIAVSEALPQATFVFKFLSGDIRRGGDGRVDAENYQFDITPDFGLFDTPGVAPVIDITKYRPERVLFASHVDGTLWAAFDKSKITPSPGLFALVNNDYGASHWQGWTAAEKPFTLKLPVDSKQIRTTYIKTRIFADMTLIHGVSKPDFGYDTVRGHIHNACRTWSLSNPFPGRPSVLLSSGTSVAIESKAIAPIVRIYTKPDANGKHRGALEAIDLDLALKHHHPK